MNRAVRAALVGATLALVGVLAGPASPVAAETCNADGSICLLTDSSPTQPLTVPASLLIRSPRDELDPLPNVTWTQGGLFDVATVQPAGGDLWLATINSIPSSVLLGTSTTLPVDGPIAVHVTGSFFLGGEPADFTIWVRAAVTGISATLTRQGRFYVSSLAFTNRVPVTVNAGLSLEAMGYFRCGKPRYCTRRGLLKKPHPVIAPSEPIAPGSYDLTSRIPVAVVGRACWYSAPCNLFYEASIAGAAQFQQIVRLHFARKGRGGR